MRQPSNAVVVATALSLLTVSLAQAAAAPAGHEAVLRRLIDSAAHGELDEQTLTPELLAVVRPQEAIAQTDLTALGELKSVTFERTGRDGSEIYLTTFEHGSLEWAFALAPDGRISNAMYRKPLLATP
jgi:hypothetical protein